MSLLEECTAYPPRYVLDQPDIWNLVMSAKDSDNAPLLEEMHSNAELFMLAGSETTGGFCMAQRIRSVLMIFLSATLLSGLTFYLLTQPEK